MCVLSARSIFSKKENGAGGCTSVLHRDHDSKQRCRRWLATGGCIIGVLVVIVGISKMRMQPSVET